MNNAEALLRYQSLEDQVKTLTERLDVLRAENRTLKRSNAKSEKDTHEFVAYFQREMEKKDDLLAQITDKYNIVQKTLEKERAESQQTYEDKVSRLKDQYEAENKRLRTRLNAAEDELTVLGEFKSVKADLQNRLDKAHAALDEECERRKREVNDIERKFIEEKSRIKRDVQAQINEIKKRSREEAQRGLSADTRKLISDNKRMGEELRFQLQTTDELQRERDQLKEDNAALNREVSLNAEKEKEYAKQGFRKEKTIRVANENIKNLEKSLAKIVLDFEREKATLSVDKDKVIQELTMECDGLKHMVCLKNKELRTIRRLGKEILDQRTQVEQFFVDALQTVKEEKLGQVKHAKRLESAKRKQERLQQMSSLKFPTIASDTNPIIRPIGSAPKPGQTIPDGMLSLSPGNNQSRVQLEDLSWADKEKVLRLLFAKINSVDTKIPILPKHSFEVGQNHPEDSEWAAQEQATSRPPV